MTNKKNFLFNLLKAGDIKTVEEFISCINEVSSHAFARLSDDAISDLFEIYKLDSTSDKRYLKNIIHDSWNSLKSFQDSHESELRIIKILKSNKISRDLFSENLFNLLVEEKMNVSIGDSRKIISRVINSDRKEKKVIIDDYVKNYYSLKEIIEAVGAQPNFSELISDYQFMSSIYELIKEDSYNKLPFEDQHGDTVIYYVNNYSKLSKFAIKEIDDDEDEYI